MREGGRGKREVHPPAKRRAFPVFESEEPVPPGDERANGHMFTYGHYDDLIWMGFCTGVVDGLGHYRVVQSILYHYCLYRYGGPLGSEGLYDLGAAPDPEEYADPFSCARMPESPYELPLPREAFVIPEKRVPADGYQTLCTITLNLMCAVETDAYFRALLKELEEAGVERRPAPQPYRQMNRVF